MDFLVAFLCLTSVAFVVERLERSRGQFGVTTLVAFVTSIGLLLSLWRLNAQINAQGAPFDPGWGYNTLRFYEASQGAVPILFAVGCTFYAITWLVLTAVSSILRFRRPAPTKVEADGSPAR